MTIQTCGPIWIKRAPKQGRRLVRKSSAGFTLVEILVVIGIIALLIAILLPAITKARAQASTVKCLANERNLMTAMLAFAGDNENRLPYTGWNSGANIQNWLYNCGASGKPSPFKESDVETGQLWKYLNSHSSFRCPLDTGPWKPNTSEVMSSYVMNGAGSSFGNNGNVGNSMLQYSPTAILFWETPLSVGVGGGGTFNDGVNFPYEGITARHAEGTTVGFVDGHVEIMNGLIFNEYVQAGVGTTTGKNKPAPNALWCDPKQKDGSRGTKSFVNPIIIQR